MAAIQFTDLGLSPVVFSLGPLSVRWYGLAYVAGFIVAALVLRLLNKRWEVGLSDDDILDLVLACVLGLVGGARIGYVLFYGAGRYWSDPLSVFAFWDGGMSFHGGLVGILLAGWWFARRKHISVLRLFDLAVGAPLGIMFGRLANFVNGELWGRVTDAPWGVVFPAAPGTAPRHPSQLYEALLEGLVLFIVLWVLSRKKRGDGLIIGTLIGLYGVFRIFVEFFREPDVQIGYLFGGITLGQLLTLPMVFIGAWLVWRAVAGQQAGEAAPEDASAEDTAPSGPGEAAAGDGGSGTEAVSAEDRDPAAD
jgi:phosphatidylglycerol:prolipoprotein diacylglycerol transferase